MKFKESFKWEYIERILVIIGALVALYGLYLTYGQLRSQTLNQSAEIILNLSDKISKEPYDSLTSTIESNGKILKENGGNFTDKDLVGYLGIYETLSNLYDNDLVSFDMIYSNFSYDIVKAYNNEEIRNYIRKDQSEDKELWKGFENLAEIFKK